MRAVAAAFVAAPFVLSGCSVTALKAYVYPAWGFAASFRSAPTEAASPPRVAGGPPAGFKVEAFAAGRDLLVSVADGSGSPKSDDEILSEFPQALAQGGALTSQTYIASGPAVGRELLIDRPGAPTQRVRIFVWQRRLYEVSARSSLGPKDPEVIEFLDSFRLLPAPPPAANPGG
jgi:hypothetical protein